MNKPFSQSKDINRDASILKCQREIQILLTRSTSEFNDMETAENQGGISTVTRENIKIQVRTSISLTVTIIFIHKKKTEKSYQNPFLAHAGGFSA